MLDLVARIDGSLVRDMAKVRGLVDKGVTQGVKAISRGLQREIKRNIKRAGLGRLEQTIKVRFFPKRGFTIRMLGVVRSKAIVRRKSGSADLLELFGQGVTIRAGAGRWLAVPTRHAPLAPGRGRTERSRASPRQTNIKRRFVPTRDPNVARLVKADQPAIVLWWLVKEVRLPKHYDIPRIERKWRKKLKPRVESRLNALAKKSGLEF